MNLENLKFIDLFAGIGGFHQAMQSFGAKCVFASEIDKHCQEVYKQNYGIKPCGDIKDIDAQEIPPHDIICAGFPCQAFSISGKQLGFADTRGTLFFDVVRIVKHHQPQFLFLENVKNLATHDNGKTLKVIITTLKDLGYSTFHQVLNASNFGLPQKRERIYILGFRNDLQIKNFIFPTQYSKKTSLNEILLSDEEIKNLVIHRNDIKWDNKQKIVLNNQKPIRLGIINKGGQGERIYSHEGHAITLSANGGGVGAKTGLYLINNRIRRLAPRECARLQGFPESFKINTSNSQAYKQFGNSVAINVLKAIIKEVLKLNIEMKKFNKAQ